MNDILEKQIVRHIKQNYSQFVAAKILTLREKAKEGDKFALSKLYDICTVNE